MPCWSPSHRNSRWILRGNTSTGPRHVSRQYGQPYYALGGWRDRAEKARVGQQILPGEGMLLTHQADSVPRWYIEAAIKEVTEISWLVFAA